MAAGGVIRVRVDEDLKNRCARLCSARGTTLSEMVRSLLEAELDTFENPVATLDAIAESAAKKVEASGLGAPSVDDLVNYVDKVREQRAEQMMAAS